MARLSLSKPSTRRSPCDGPVRRDRIVAQFVAPELWPGYDGAEAEETFLDPHADVNWKNGGGWTDDGSPSCLYVIGWPINPRSRSCGVPAPAADGAGR